MTHPLLAKRLKELRRANSYTQEYVASYLNIIRQTYSHYETGRNTPSTEMLYKLATLYSIPVNDFLQLTIIPDPDSYIESPPLPPSVHELSQYLEFTTNPSNEKKLKYLNKRERELIYYFGRISPGDQEEIIEFIKIKAKRIRPL